ncbi:DUF829 domain-containing protein [Campylobacter hepaticus]|uniref:DUF829 domain-containing protein n=1 Tax=Campylobacter hepaticus TaxID=1813019 RepID=A0A424YZZ6_9BACT|nr:DUF829 domain-containing protein [Campylobacter hepaticus]RQD67442.1 DUF829 domain-containing protein [Campylobacter hepaticus]RQD86991.1 DUF829 domain-containing protein [Campylobacter hepaticus]
MYREVFYIAGYDPKSYRFYYDLFKKNLKEYSYQFNLKATMHKIEKNENFPFFKIFCENVQTKYHFLVWNDIVKQNWSQNYKDALLDCYSFFRIYTLTGLFIKFAKESIYQLITGYYPFFYVLFSLLFSMILALGTFVFLQNHIPIFFAVLIGIFLGFLLNRFLFKMGKKLAVFWIARICAFCATWKDKKKGAMEERIKLFAHTIIDKLEQNKNKQDYELILVAHSVGTIVCIEVLEHILKQIDQTLLTKLKILTLGECIPLVSYQKNANKFREKLEFISRFDLKWYDYTSIIDGACFPQVDFFRTSRVNARFAPVFLNAKFHTLYEKHEYKKIKRDKNKAHFLYLYSAKIKGDYDFFSFIVAPKFLEEKVKI